MSNRNLTLDLVRGISALLVCAGHLRIALFKDFAELHDPGVLQQLFYFSTGLGHQAVIVFFVLSGYFVGGAVIGRINSFKMSEYLINRLSRLYTPFIPALIFTLILDLIIGEIAPSLIAGEFYNAMNSGPNHTYSASAFTFLENIFFLQSIYAPVFGSNNPLWSLAYEFWYYITFPILLIATGFLKRNLYAKLFFALTFIGIAVFILPLILEGFIIWLMGVLVFYFREIKISSFVLRFISMMLFLIFLLDSKLSFLGSTFFRFNEILIGASFSLFLFFIKDSNLPNLKLLRLHRLAFWSSEVSYTLYIFHFPLIMLLVSFYSIENQFVLDLFNILKYLGFLIGIIMICFAMWYIFERNTPLVRNKLKSMNQHFLTRIIWIK